MTGNAIQATRGLKWAREALVRLTTKVRTAIDARTMKASMAASALLLTICPAWCDINGGTALKNFLKTLFNVLIFAGIVLIIAGAASLIRTIVSIASGEQAQPGAIGRGLGLLIGGIVLAALKAIITAVIGTDPTSINFLG